MTPSDGAADEDEAQWIFDELEQTQTKLAVEREIFEIFVCYAECFIPPTSTTLETVRKHFNDNPVDTSRVKPLVHGQWVGSIVTGVNPNPYANVRVPPPLTPAQLHGVRAVLPSGGPLGTNPQDLENAQRASRAMMWIFGLVCFVLAFLMVLWGQRT